MERKGQQAFWHANRMGHDRKDIPGTRMHISFVDLDFKIADPPATTLFAHMYPDKNFCIDIDNMKIGIIYYLQSHDLRFSYLILIGVFP